MYYHSYVIMHVKLSIVRVGHHVPVAGFYLFLNTSSLHTLNKDFNVVQLINPIHVADSLTNTKGRLYTFPIPTSTRQNHLYNMNIHEANMSGNYFSEASRGSK